MTAIEQCVDARVVITSQHGTGRGDAQRSEFRGVSSGTRVRYTSYRKH